MWTGRYSPKISPAVPAVAPQPPPTFCVCANSPPVVSAALRQIAFDAGTHEFSGSFYDIKEIAFMFILYRDATNCIIQRDKPQTALPHLPGGRSITSPAFKGWRCADLSCPDWTCLNAFAMRYTIANSGDFSWKNLRRPAGFFGCVK